MTATMTIMGNSDHRQDAADAPAVAGTTPAEAASQGDELVDIHKPKPVHGWRELVNEIGVIVIGVMIALAGEQAVEALHWRHVVDETRQSLGASVQDAHAAMLSRKDMQACVDRKLAEIGTIIDRHYQGAPVAIVAPIGAPTASFAQTYAFDMAIASQAFSHMSIADQARFFEPIGSYHTFDDVIKDERNTWQTFAALDRVASLTPSDWSDLRKAYDRASNLNAVLSADLKADVPGQWLYSFRGFPALQTASYSLRSIPRVRQLCRPSIATPERPA